MEIKPNVYKIYKQSFIVLEKYLNLIFRPSNYVSKIVSTSIDVFYKFYFLNFKKYYFSQPILYHKYIFFYIYLRL